MPESLVATIVLATAAIMTPAEESGRDPHLSTSRSVSCSISTLDLGLAMLTLAPFQVPFYEFPEEGLLVVG